MKQRVVLGLDAAAKTAGVAILQGDALLYECWLAAGLTHSETLLQLVDGALCATRLAAADIDVFALTAGPGSFTGLRIGMALIKGLAADGRPCVGVSTLEALAAGAGAAGLIVPAMDARRGEVYTAAFWREDADGPLRRLTPDDALPASTALQSALAAAGNAGLAADALTLAGDGAALCAAACEKLAAPKPALRLPGADRSCRAAAAAARIGAAAYERGEAVTAADLRPDYHRLSQAERERLARQSGAG